MSKHPEFHNIDDSSDAIVRQLADGLTAHIYPGDQAMISVVTVAPGAEGSMHDHPEEQWGLCLEGSGIRYQGGEEVAFSKGDFWRTPGGVPHTMRAGENGCRITGGETQQEEDEDGDDQHDRDRGQDALQDIDEHFPEGPFRRKEGRPGSGGTACGQR